MTPNGRAEDLKSEQAPSPASGHSIAPKLYGDAKKQISGSFESKTKHDSPSLKNLEISNWP